MESTFGIRIIWILAGQEAGASKYEYIEVEHLFSSLLKFTEMDDVQLLSLIKTPDMLGEVVKEKEALIKVMEKYGIKVPEVSNKLRNIIRKDMGAGHYNSGERKQISRSQEAKKVFYEAERYAKKRNAVNYSTMHLFKIIFDIPRPFIIQALGKARLEIKHVSEFTEGFQENEKGKEKVPDEKEKKEVEKAGNKKGDSVLPAHLKYRQALAPFMFASPFNKPEKPEEPKISGDKKSPENPFVQLMGKLRKLRKYLSSKIFGQEHAIQTVIEGLYNAEIDASVNIQRNRPAAVFVFAGPPGVGKTYMAELIAEQLERPFKRFDMTGFSDQNSNVILIGIAKFYTTGCPGILTDYVSQNPRAILLFDEIEKAHLTTIQLFYQILDSGRLEDKYMEKDVSFKDTIIIFTTNAGKSLYDNPNKVGISAVNSGYHRRTILSALANEKNPADNNHAFPQPICSRLGQGYPVMFNRLGINELERLADNAIRSTEELLKKHYNRKFYHDTLLPISLVFREGGSADARQLKAESEKFIKDGLFGFSSLYEEDKIEDIFKDFDGVYYEVEKNEAMPQEVKDLYDTPEKPKILIISDLKITLVYNSYVSEIQWFNAYSSEEAADILSTEDINLILLDLWIGRHEGSENSGMTRTIRPGQDSTPLSAKALNKGRDILRKLHKRFSDIPVYLLSINKNDSSDDEGEKDEEVMTTIFDMKLDKKTSPERETTLYRVIDEELFLACVRAGGARGLVSTNFFDTSGGRDWVIRRNLFATGILAINRSLYREKQAEKLMKEHRVLSFETAPLLLKQERKLVIRLRNFHLTDAIDAADAGLILDNVERPEIKFSHVAGAKAAKESLQFVINWLKKSRYYKCMGVRPPKGILLTGPPGTGKTMLARAVAGESSCAFIETSAANFITIWQGSGSQNIRDIFSRARRYAPAIVFIDEIDAIGKTRSASPGGAARAEENTLNSLLTEMDGFSASSASPVIVLAATNLVEHLDPALKRRFDRIIEVDRPDKEARLEYIEKTLSGRKINKVSPGLMEKTAGQSAGMTIADLARILQEAAVMAVEKNKELTDEILEEAFERIRMGESKKLPDRKSLERIAVHEAGHTVIAWLGGKIPFQVTIVGRGDAGGYMEREAEEDRMVYTKSDLEQRICEAMGGRAAEILHYGQEAGLSTGVSGDLKRATSIALMMVQEYGMDEDFGLFALDRNIMNEGPFIREVYRAAEKIVKTQQERALKLLGENRKKLDYLREKLLEKNRLSKEELERILR